MFNVADHGRGKPKYTCLSNFFDVGHVMALDGQGTPSQRQRMFCRRNMFHQFWANFFCLFSSSILESCPIPFVEGRLRFDSGFPTSCQSNDGLYIYAALQLQETLPQLLPTSRSPHKGTFSSTVSAPKPCTTSPISSIRLLGIFWVLSSSSARRFSSTLWSGFAC
jgi:hypothetical protein